jgi:protein TonB
MVSAYAVRPPDLVRSAGFHGFGRRFLERALVLSAVVHLAAAGLFRAAEERDGRRPVPQAVGIPEQAHTVNIFIPLNLPPLVPRLPGSSSARVGEIEPVPIPGPEVLLSDFGFPRNGKPIGPEGGPGTNVGTPDPSPPDGTPAFAGADTPPELVDAPKPAYPDWAKEAGVEGKVLLRVLVGKDGRPRKVIATGGVRALGEDAAKAVMRWTFRPALSNGNPIEVWVEVPVVFRLQR